MNRRAAAFEMKGSGELADERTALAEFADEPVLTPLSRATAVGTAPVFAKVSAASSGVRIRPVPLLDPRSPLLPVLWTFLIGCVSAMAFGASFAIGFKYVWTDGPNRPRVDAVEILPTRLSGHGSFFVPYRPAVESHGSVAVPSESDAVRAKRARQSVRWIRRTIAAADLSPLLPTVPACSRVLHLPS
jgi:hypothetical protein